jgi:hypothetical protein
MQNPTAVGINTLQAEFWAARATIAGLLSGSTDSKDA